MRFFIVENTRTYKGTALHLAASKGRPRCLEVLLEFGSDIRKTNSQGLRPLDICLENSDPAFMTCSSILAEKWDQLRVEAEKSMEDLILDDEKDKIRDEVESETEMKKKAARREKRRKKKAEAKTKATRIEIFHGLATES